VSALGEKKRREERVIRGVAGKSAGQSGEKGMKKRDGLFRCLGWRQKEGGRSVCRSVDGKIDCILIVEEKGGGEGLIAANGGGKRTF